MPPPSSVSHLPSTHPAARQKPKSPNRVLAEAEVQWLFTDAELANTPSIQDGMTQNEEEELRAKGVNFIVQVGILLKLPQLTLSTAAIFFQRFLMRASLKTTRNGIPKLHHYQSAATALFLATKVEESCRKMKELVQACCRVAQRNPNLVIDEQSKDFWKWRDCILDNEDVILEVLCFDLTVESPHRQLFEMLKWYGVEHNKRLRNAAWAFVTDSNNTRLCLLCNSRTIAVAGLYAACRFCEIQLPDDAKGRPWWETQHVRLSEVRKAVQHMTVSYQDPAGKSVANGTTGVAGSEGQGSIYVGLTPPSLDGADDVDTTRLRNHAQGAVSASPHPSSLPGKNSVGSSDDPRSPSNVGTVGLKRGHDGTAAADSEKRAAVVTGVENGDKENKRPRLDTLLPANGPVSSDTNDTHASHDVKVREEKLRVQNGNAQAEADVQAASGPAPPGNDVEGSEEGEVEE